MTTKTHVDVLDAARTTQRQHLALRARIRQAGPDSGARLAARVVWDGGSSMQFRHLLRAVPGVGKVRADLMLDAAGISPFDRVDDLIAPRRRHLLAAMLIGADQPTADLDVQHTNHIERST